MQGSLQVPADWVENLCVPSVLKPFRVGQYHQSQIKIYLDDTYVQAIDVNHREITLTKQFLQKEVKLKIDLFSGRSDKPFPLQVNLLALDPAVNDVWYDFYTLFDSWRAIRAFGGDEAFYQQVLGQVANVLDFRTPTQRHSMKVSQKQSSCFHRVTYQRIHQNKR